MLVLQERPRHEASDSRQDENPLPLFHCLHCRREDSNLHSLNGNQVLKGFGATR
jgi:hypothetical protein